MDYKKKMRMLRERFDMTAGDLAREIGVSPSTVSNYESGIRSPGMEMMGKIASALQTDVNTLFYDESEKLFP